MRKYFVCTLWALLAVFVLIAALSFTAIAKGWIGYMPPVEDLQNPISRFATQIYSADGKIMGTWNYNKENRICVDYDQMSPHLIQALVATEDVRFSEHSGIDFIALGRAVVKRGLMGQKSAGGGSTITQQLAKQLFTEKAHSVAERLMQKPIEWVIAVQLERTYTKDEIIALYLNDFDFLHNAVGIKTATNTYFGKDPKNLSVNEAATLIGLCKNPSYFNPVRHPERCVERRNVVLAQMEKAGYLSASHCDSLSNLPLGLNFHVSDHKDGIATYLREFLRTYLMAKQPQRSQYPDWAYAKYVQDAIAWETDPRCGWCNKNKKKDGTPYNIYTDGLKVYTTIDSRMQDYAEKAVERHVVNYLQPAFNRENKGKPNAPYSGKLSKDEVKRILMRSVRQSDRWRNLKALGMSEDKILESFRRPTEMTIFSYHGEVDTVMTPLDSIKYYKSFLRCGFMCMSPVTGEVKAYVGGMNFSHINYNMCMDGSRQVDSTIKPYIYSLAMEKGMSPCDQAPNVQQTYIVAGQRWTPRNASHRRYGEMVPLKWGLAQSNNWITAWVMSHLSPYAFVDLLHKYGVTNPNMHPSMSLCLGPCEITVGQMVSAYSAFANKGIRTAPLFVTRIEDNEGNVISTFHPRMNEVISEESAAKMIYMLKGEIDGGTGGRIRYKYNMDCEMGGKTGTTNNNSDAWFMGFTPQLVAGVWVGGDDRDIHFDTSMYGQGATMALPIWAYFMQKVFADKSLDYDVNAKFDLPPHFNPCNMPADSISNDVMDNDVEEIYE